MGSRTRTKRASRRVAGHAAGAVTGQVAKREPRCPVRPAVKLHDEQISLLNLETHVSIRTIERWAMGFPVLRNNKMRLEEAVVKHGLELEKKEAGTSRRRVVAKAA